MSMDKEDGFERGFVAGWKARGEHEDGLLIEAELAKRQAEEAAEMRKPYDTLAWAQFAAKRDAEIRQQNALHTQAEDGLDDLSLRLLRQQRTAPSEAARVVQGEQQIAALSGQAFCKNCGFPAKTCVCVPQQVNQQSWQGATARHDP